MRLRDNTEFMNSLFFHFFLSFFVFIIIIAAKAFTNVYN